MDNTDISSTIDTIYRQHSRRAFASLVSILGDFDVAEDALHEAFKAALEQWPSNGVPSNPVAWLVSAGRFKAIDMIRRQSRFDSLGDRLDEVLAIPAEWSLDEEMEPVKDERLKLIFTCCHPAISPDTQIALTLREVCDLSTEAIAYAYLTPVPTIAQRIVRAKSKIRLSKIPFSLPEPDELSNRLDAVLRVIYLVFNEGYSASFGENSQRPDLAAEGVRLARLLAELLPSPEVLGLLALMLLHTARSASRATAEGDLIPLDEQERNLWDRVLIAEGTAFVRRALESSAYGAYTLQAAISATHCEAVSWHQTDWHRIVELYESLAALELSPVVELNLSVAIAMRDGPEAAIERVNALIETSELRTYGLAHAVQADLYQRLGNAERAYASFQSALSLTRQEPQRRFLIRKFSEEEI
jgi:RNA polymerase sigma-70 factor, ECF subfamily